MTLLNRASLRFYLRHPWQLGLAIVGVSLGVAVYVGVSLANDSAGRAFDIAAARVRGETTHRLLPVDGMLDETLYRDLVLRSGIAAAAPIVAGEVRITSRAGQRVPLLGIDPIAQGALRVVRPGADADADFARLLTEPGTVLLPMTLAADLGIERNGLLTLVVAEREVEVRAIGFVPDGIATLDNEPPLVADVATAQELLGVTGRLSRIDLELTDEQARALTAASLPNALLIPTETERDTFRQLTAAFRTNLMALGLLALVVGMFLIYGTMAFAVLQRTRTLGILRAMGVARREILASIVLEAAVIAAIAAAIGLVLGHALATGLVGLVLQTIGDLSFGSAVSAVEPSPWLYVRGAALGLGATLVAAAKPALDATRIEPTAALRRAVLERRASTGARRAAVVAVLLLAIGGALLVLGPSDLAFAFGALFGVLAAGALLTPLATIALMNVLDRAIGRGLGIAVTLAIRGVGASLSRTGVATAALAVAVATVNGVGLMIFSFRTSLDAWLDTTLTADLYVNGDGTDLAELAASGALTAIAGVDGLTLTQNRLVPTARGDIAIRAVRPGRRGFGLAIVAGDADEALAQLADGRAVVASERLLFARSLAIGDEIELTAPAGATRLPVAAAFRDFNTSTPGIVMSLDRYRRDWNDAALGGIGIDLAAGTNAQAVEAAVRSLVGPSVRVRSSATIEQISLAVFDRTFKVTEVLRILAGIVAFLGILGALLAIELERARELSVLRTLGFTPQGLSATLLTQTGLLGLAAGLAAIPIGSALAALLVHVINRRSFGWSMELVISAEAVLAGLAVAVAAALLAGLYPAWRASRVELAAGLRED
jgi:putative ABC transport system permease protein